MKSLPTGQLLLTGVPGTELDAETRNTFRRIQPGGFILFGRNIQSPPQLRKLIDDLRAVSDIEPIITIDQEGGRVSRLRLIGEEPPNAQALRDKGDPELIRRHGDITGRLLRLFGFNLDLCPVLDLSFDDEADNSLRGRCYGKTVEQVVHLAGTFNDAMRNAGVLSCGKHFPGYASATIDPHHELPCIDRSRETLEEFELAPFRRLIDRLDSMMICHSHYPAFDKETLPASLSPAVIQNLLRGEMKFQGLVMTDDLDMGAILNTFGFDDTIRRAVHAGNDLVMICHRVEMVERAQLVINELDDDDIIPALESVQAFKQRMSPPTRFDMDVFKAINREIWDLRVATLGEERARERSTEDGKRSPVELY